MLKIKLIVTMDKNGTMAHRNKLPWDLQDNLKEIKKEISGSPIIMGSKTAKHMAKNMPSKEQIVISSKMDSSKNCSVFTSIKQAIDYVSEDHHTAYVIGGSNLIKQFCDLNLFDELIITHVDSVTKNADTVFDIDALRLVEWNIYDTKHFSKSSKNDADFKISRYIKKIKRFY